MDRIIYLKLCSEDRNNNLVSRSWMDQSTPEQNVKILRNYFSKANYRLMIIKVEKVRYRLRDEKESPSYQQKESPRGFRRFWERWKKGKQNRNSGNDPECNLDNHSYGRQDSQLNYEQNILAELEEKQEREENQESERKQKRERKIESEEKQKQEKKQKREKDNKEWISEITHSILEQIECYEEAADKQSGGRRNYDRSNIYYTVYDASLEKWLRWEGCLPLWKEYWPYPEFDAYHELTYVEELLVYGHSPYYIILGYDPTVPELIIRHIRKMKSLRLILDYLPKGLEGFLEDLYEEYGLAITLQLLEDEQEHPFRRVRFSCPHPCVILDFSGEEKVFVNDVADGSVWVDMDSMEEKQWRMEERDKGIEYISLKKHWMYQRGG